VLAQESAGPAAGSSSTVGEPIIQTSSPSQGINDDELNKLMNRIEEGETDPSVAFNAMPVVKSPVLDAGPSSEVVDPITQQPTFSSEISDDDLDLLMTMIEKELGHGSNTSKPDEAAKLSQKHSGKTNVKYQ
jgi:hypothetical protein